MAEGIFHHQNDKDFIDLIFSSGNGVCEVDPEWFNHAVAGTVFQTPVRFPAPEEMKLVARFGLAAFTASLP